MNEGDAKCSVFYSGTMQGKDHEEGLGSSGRIIFE
jgi:hypothetical protein